MIEDSYKINVVIEKDEYGYYAYCPQLEGCQTQGDTIEEVKTNITEAIELYLSTLSEEEKTERLSQEIITMTMEVKVA
ncbi:type II toxin-antitoxin system HicB family antitoxin [Crocosphaera sp.]|uniref:type II toxin-antitoxin system HicB family antitoxin n=1 Tax=Crocosphaera sp. TaxID=2729996 RepID=UPI002608DADB|nr:type II toxin-antitoxin system HicB family antitoxin [Crocosphaera sp.]MDJ0582512.1 type II toxin-antitoxin system HicB family antitoxin [Crocosphaera sp.]